MYMMRSGNQGTYLEAIQSLRYVCFTVLHTVTDRNITSAYMVQNGLVQQPQVSLFPEVIPLLLIPTYTHSSQALTGLYAFPLKHALEPYSPSTF
jgi:hypothetical protein